MSVTDPPPTPQRVLYRIHSSKATFAELWRDAGSPLGKFTVTLSKLLRLDLPGSVNDPNVESLQPFEISETELPDPVREKLAAAAEDLKYLGFGDPVLYHLIGDVLHSSRAYVAALPHSDGTALARIHFREEGGAAKPKTHFYIDFLSGFADGGFLWSTSARSALAAPAGCRVNRLPGALPLALWESHRKQMEGFSGRSIVKARASEEVRAFSEQHHVLIRDFHLARGVFSRMSEGDQKQSAHLEEVRTSGHEHADVLAELEKLQNRKTSWASAVFILIISLGLFIGAGRAQGPWRFVLLLIPILLFHEAGHYLAMRLFDYRNIKMFFIPFLA